MDASLPKTWRAHDNTEMPKQGMVGTVSIPATQSHFAARKAVIYPPPAALVANPPVLPLLVSFTGQPGSPTEMFTPGQVPVMLDSYAAAHAGLAPIVVVPALFGSTIDILGELVPTMGAKTLSEAFRGSRAAYEAIKPLPLLAWHTPYADSVAIFGAGAKEKRYGAYTRQIEAVAAGSGMKTRLVISPNSGHDWYTARMKLIVAQTLLTFPRHFKRPRKLDGDWAVTRNPFAPRLPLSVSRTPGARACRDIRRFGHGRAVLSITAPPS